MMIYTYIHATGGATPPGPAWPGGAPEHDSSDRSTNDGRNNTAADSNSDSTATTTTTTTTTTKPNSANPASRGPPGDPRSSRTSPRTGCRGGPHPPRPPCLHPVSLGRFPSFRTQPLEKLTPLPMKKTYLSNPAPGENLLSGNLVMETGCVTIMIIIIIIVIIMISHCYY